MTTGPESNDLDRMVEESMRLFERSRVGPAARITTLHPSRVLLVLDGSPQDKTSVAAASYLRERFNTETLVLDARPMSDSADVESPASNEHAESQSRQISGARPIARKAGEPYDVILEALRQHAVELVIVPCPFGRSFESIGTDSAGTVIDVLLARCPQALLVIRREDQMLRNCVHHVAMVVGGECDVEHQAAGWALGLAEQSAEVTLNLVVEREQYENIRSILRAMQPVTEFQLEQFSDALAKSHQDLHGGMAKTASELGLRYSLRPVAGEVAPPHPLRDPKQMLLVIPLEVDDRFEQGFVQDRIRRSPHPVLVVPGHVPS